MLEIYWGELITLFISVWITLHELCSYCKNANLMVAKFRVVRKIENVASDIQFLEECARKEWVPKGFRWKFKAQGIGEDDERKVKQIKKDAAMRVMDIMIKGLRTKEEDLTKKRDKLVDTAWEEKTGWDRIKWMESLGECHKKYKEEARVRKGRKL